MPIQVPQNNGLRAPCSIKFLDDIQPAVRFLGDRGEIGEGSFKEVRGDSCYKRIALNYLAYVGQIYNKRFQSAFILKLAVTYTAGALRLSHVI